ALSSTSSPGDTGAVIVNVSVLDTPPPGAGFRTVTPAVPASARSAASMLAHTRVALTNVVGRSDPFHLMTEDGRKSLPSTVRVNAAEPCGRLAGDSVVVEGSGFGGALRASWSAHTSRRDVLPPRPP